MGLSKINDVANVVHGDAFGPIDVLSLSFLTTQLNRETTNINYKTNVPLMLLLLSFRSRHQVHALTLNVVHRHRSLEFARHYRNWMSTERRQVAFSDESSFMLKKIDRRKRIRETSESRHPATIAGTIQAGGGRIMDNGIYQQDNAKCHAAGSARAWFEEYQDAFVIIPWPANSVDLKLIENLWDHLNWAVLTMNPHPRNLAQLAMILAQHPSKLLQELN
ncbi:transposable element Tcb1 transposase [Trichonephila clavipes]|nr:transposable element Tcb1 transposase [Trichonephila clavipes]